MSEMIAGHEGAETAIIDKGEDHEEPYRYWLVGADGHEFPMWPDEIGHFRDLLDEFEAVAGDNPSVPASSTEDSPDPIIEVLPNAPMPMEDLYVVLENADIQIRGHRPLPHFYGDTALPTAFYLLSPPGYRAYAYDTDAYEWCRVTTVENNKGDRSSDGMREIKDAVKEWHGETVEASNEPSDGNT